MTTPGTPGSQAMQLGGEQQRVIESTAPALLVLGGAGCGKTTAALAAARRHLREIDASDRPLAERRVLFVTFSRTAVEQIRDRSAGVSSDVGDRIEISTFHGLAFRFHRSFGRYFGGAIEPTIMGDARGRLLGADNQRLTYRQLIPQALRIVHSDTNIARLIRRRWSLVICDEFQDTDDAEWELLLAVAANARLILLADPNQMIYSGFKDGVSLARLSAALAQPGCEQIELPLDSHRDPSQILPAAALAVRHRNFTSPVIDDAIASGRLIIATGVPDDVELRAERIAAELDACKSDGLTSCGIYLKTNADVATMSEALTALKVRHVPVGFSEAFGESLEAQLTLARYARNATSWRHAVEALAVVVTANDRRRDPPQLALMLVAEQPVAQAFDQRLNDLRSRLDLATGDLDALQIAAEAWATLGIASGQRDWDSAARTLIAVAHRTNTVCSALDTVASEIEALRTDSFISTDRGNSGRTELMNFSQTKGREADATILSYSSSDYYGRASEPYDEASRIVYVSMTRARHRVIVLLPDSPHAVVAPLSDIAVSRRA